MNKINEYLEQLDISDIETNIYLTLLKTGPLSIRELAERINIKRTTAYFPIEQLIEKGLVIKVVKGSHKQIAATHPEDSLKNLIEHRLKTAQTMQAQFPDMLKEINAAYPQIEKVEEAEIRYYKGKKGIKKIYEEILKSKEIRSYANLTDIFSIFPENKYSFIIALKENKNLTVWEIIEKSHASKEQIRFAGSEKRYHYKFMPDNLKLNATDIIIYDGKVCIINITDKRSISGVVLSDINYYNNSKTLFEFIWEIIPESTVL